MKEHLSPDWDMEIEKSIINIIEFLYQRCVFWEQSYVKNPDSRVKDKLDEVRKEFQDTVDLFYPGSGPS